MNTAQKVMRDIVASARVVRKLHPTVQDGLVLTRGNQLRPAPIKWLWKHWLARGKLHVLAGMPGQGKTTLAMAVAAAVTSGGAFPDGSSCPLGNVVIWSGEDDAADGLLPKLMAAGADVSRIYFIEGMRVDGQAAPFDPAQHMPLLLEKMQEIGDVSLLVVDPVVTVVAGDSHKNTEVRRALQPLVDLGAQTGAAVLGISHFSKGGQGQDPAQRVVGSVAFTAVARVVLVAAKTASSEGEDIRIIARGKSNIGPDDGGFEYHLQQREVLPGIEASTVAWGRAVEGSARDLLTPPGEDDDRSAVAGAEDFLVELLAQDTVPSKQVFAEAREAGFSVASIRRAADRLGVRKTKGGMNAGWYWRLRGQDLKEQEENR